MHQTRQQVTTRIPIQRKGTKYVARASSDLKNSVPVVVALRDMLKIARTSAEVKKMIHDKMLKINGRLAHDSNESIKIFGILEADKKYQLTILPTKRFDFEEISDNERICKISNKVLVKNNSVQYNLHDGTNFISDKNMSVGDSVYLDFSGKVKSHVKLSKGSSVFIFLGKYAGFEGLAESVDGSTVIVKIKDKEAPVSLHQRNLIAL